ncbi:LuxR family two component transcriptional regulator [Williamsia limnetica]|uniref:LuxR family two component transcriptional regulator n=1 Tax=Williamsia limnetica TaxID=882452 RepID=A0A318RDA2_WILLI|nr:response regulator transcription factor [Williamsia limnetica]PYE14330.1 LuxR family two component transcriptional regulator [Williamsia limnetica]
MTMRIILADDQELLRGTFRLLIDSQADMTVVAEAGTGRQAIELTRQHVPDIVLMDIRMPDTDGLGATEIITADPQLTGVKIVILTTFEQDEYVARALRGGASGFIGKGISPSALLDAMRVVAAGDALLSPTATRSLIERYLAAPQLSSGSVPSKLERLTAREREIMSLIATGLTNSQIAASLYISETTVKTHANRAMSKLQAHDRAQLVVIAYETGLVRITPRDG